MTAPGTQGEVSPESTGKQHLQPSGARQTRNRPLPALLGTMRNKIDYNVAKESRSIYRKSSISKVKKEIPALGRSGGLSQ
jgi:hypothetical protein